MEVSFSLLALLCLVAIVGPMLNLPRRFSLPVIVGELIVGMVVGQMGFGLVDATDETFTFMAEIGFALVMFIAGTHVPLGDSGMARGLRNGVLRAALVGVLAVPAGLGIAWFFGSENGALYAVLLASSSATLVVPSMGKTKITGKHGMEFLVQIAVADAVAIVLLPLAINPSNAGKAALGGLIVIGMGVMYALIVRKVSLRKMRTISKKHGFALELRIVLVVLFAMAAIATSMNVSVMLAGFVLGMAVKFNGQPKRLKRQMFALSEGFFGPLFFIWLGASIDLRQLAAYPEAIGAGLALGLVGLVVHAVPAFTKQPLSLAVATGGQLGVPIGAVTLGQKQGMLNEWEPAAILLGAVVTVAGIAIAMGPVRTFFKRQEESPGRGERERVTPRLELGDHEYKPTSPDGTTTDKGRFARMQANLWRKEAKRQEGTDPQDRDQ